MITLIASLWIKLDRLYLNLLLFLFNKTGCLLPGEAEMLPANREVTSALRDHFPHSVKNEEILLKIWRIDWGKELFFRMIVFRGHNSFQGTYEINLEEINGNLKFNFENEGFENFSLISGCSPD